MLMLINDFFFSVQLSYQWLFSFNIISMVEPIFMILPGAPQTHGPALRIGVGLGIIYESKYIINKQLKAMSS